MNRKDLIEKAAKAIWVERNGGDPEWAEMAWSEITSPDDWNQEALDALEEARAALTVFEEANTSSDEREALANLIPLDLIHDRGREGMPLTVFEAADRILAAGFHRTVQGEHQKMAIYDGNETVCVTCPRNSYGEYVAWDQAHPQGEPTAEDRAAARIEQTIAYVRASWLGHGEPVRNTPAGEIIAILRGMRTFNPEQGEPSNVSEPGVSDISHTQMSVKGEPSDAQVIAAVDAFMASQALSEDGPSLVHKNIDAALRAAAEQ